MQKYIIYPFYSKKDFANNCYWAFRALNTENGKIAEGTISGGESNIKASPLYFCEDRTWDSANKICAVEKSEEKPIRIFNKEVKNFKYAGCTYKEIADFIINNTN